ncbi:MAG: diphthamide synthesis protein [Nanoarchaeota archaeon]|nr:diphthamide synthesis protein [Nanoarchaeota archaeon]
MYNLELENAIKEIKKSNAKTVCIQLPEGLKPKAKEITDKIEEQTNVKVIIWLNSCFGACDTPDLKEKADMLIQWGHSKWE